MSDQTGTRPVSRLVPSRATEPDPGGLVDAAQRLVQATIGVAPTHGNRVTVLRNGDEIFPAMLEAIGRARRTIELETYVYWTGDIADRFAGALAERARAGVDVRVLVDWVGGRAMDRGLITTMRDAGVRFAWFRPPGRVARAVLSLDEGLVGQHRTHRKVLVCDEQVGFTGGVGIADEWTGDARDPSEWRDTHLRIEGPAVQSLRSAFVTNWHEATSEDATLGGQTTPPDTPGGSTLQVVRGQPGRFASDVSLLLRALVEHVEDRLWVATAYFAPDDEVADRLVSAVERGVDVRVLVPGPHIDKRVSRLAARESMAPLLEHGVEVFEYEPTMLHCKVLVADEVAVCGSANLNMRSLHQDDEVVVVIHDPEVVDELAADLADDLTRSTRMDPARFERRPTHQRLAESSVAVLRRFL